MADKKEITQGNATMLGVTAIKPVERHGWEAISWFLYDKNTGAIMGRTPKSWLLIFLFYVVYYSCLAGFWAACLAIFMNTTITYEEPKWQQEQSIIGWYTRRLLGQNLGNI